MMELPTRARNTMLAGALGDVWTGPFEGSAGPQRALFGGSPSLSDDIWLALATCEAIARHGAGVRTHALSDVFREWFARKRFRSAGSATFNALRDLAAAGGRPVMADEGGAATAGVALRAAPLALVMDPQLDVDRTRLRDAIALTHGGDDAWAGALAMACAVRICIDGNGIPANLPAMLVERLPDTPVRERLIAFDRAMPEAGDPAAVRTIEEVVALAVVISARTGDSLETALTAAATLGDDSQVLPALVGQIAGAAGLPVSVALVQRLPERDEVDQILQRFVDGVTGAMA